MCAEHRTREPIPALQRDVMHWRVEPRWAANSSGREGFPNANDRVGGLRNRIPDRVGKAFSIAELVIVAAVIGILAALMVPSLSSHAAEARKAAAREDLQLLRGAIELYAARHGGVPPGYEGNKRNNTPTAERFENQMTVEDRCLLYIPPNPFNDLRRVRIIGNGDGFPTQATGHDGWIYQPATKTIRVDWPGNDLHGFRYFDY